MYGTLLYDGSKDHYCVNSLKIYSNGTFIISGTVYNNSDDRMYMVLSSIRIYKEYVILPWQLRMNTNDNYFADIFRKYDNDTRRLYIEPAGVVIDGTICNYTPNDKQYRLCGISSATGSYFDSNIVDNPLAYCVRHYGITNLNSLVIDFGKPLIMPTVSSIFKPFSSYFDIIIQTAE